MGTKPSIPDFILFEYINYANHLCDQAYQWYPYLEAFHNRMASNPNLKKYLAGPHHAKLLKRWIPSPPAKINICTDEKVVVPGKLYYFEVEGRACGIRMLLAHANVNYVDARQSGEAFGALK